MPRRGAKEWTPHEIVKVLPVEAVTHVEGSPSRAFRHQVTLTFSHLARQWVLGIDETPGHWLMSTILLGWPEPRVVDAIRFPERMYVDMGQGWYVANWREVVTAALKEI